MGAAAVLFSQQARTANGKSETGKRGSSRWSSPRSPVWPGLVAADMAVLGPDQQLLPGVKM